MYAPRFSERRCAWVVLALIACVGGAGSAGCGGTRATLANPDKARAALRTALDHWHAGHDYQSLAQGDPAIIFNDHDCKAGSQLLAYKLQGDEIFGNSLRCPVSLSLRTREGKTREKKIAYLVDTDPRIVIVREDLGG